MKTKDLLKELGKYLEKKGWKALLIEEEGILKGDDGKKDSFRLSFKFIGKKRRKMKNSKKLKKIILFTKDLDLCLNRSEKLKNCV